MSTIEMSLKKLIRCACHTCVWEEKGETTRLRPLDSVIWDHWKGIEGACGIWIPTVSLTCLYNYARRAGLCPGIIILMIDIMHHYCFMVHRTCVIKVTTEPGGIYSQCLSRPFRGGRFSGKISPPTPFQNSGYSPEQWHYSSYISHALVLTY